jgi:predicted Zn-dependent peptidase
MTTKSVETRGAFVKSTLDNGLRVVTCEMPHTRSVSIGIFVGVGSRYEPDEQAGTSHLIEHLLFKGTKRRPGPGDITGTIEETGGVINAGTEQEMTTYWCKVAEPHFLESLDLMIDMLRCSVFRPEDIERERMVVIDELGMLDDYPNSKVDALIDEMLWPDHPMGRDIGGTEESVSAITRDMMLEFMALHYNPSNIVLSVAGNVAHDEVVREAARLCGDWPDAEPQGWIRVDHVQTSPQVRVEYRKTEQAHLSIALPGVPVNDPGQYPLDLLSIVLGEGMSSRLFMEVRERLGLAYDVHSGVTHFKDCGAFVITAGVDPDRLYEAVRTILGQVDGVRDGVTEEELEKAKRLIEGRLLLRMEDSKAVSGWMGTQELLLGNVYGTDEIVERARAVSLGDVQKAAGEVLVGQRLNLAVVGPFRGARRLQRILKL